MSNLSCDLYHHNAPVRVLPLEPKRIDDEIVTQMSLRTLLVLAIMSGLIGLGTAAWMDHHYKKRDRVEQELVTWRMKP